MSVGEWQRTDRSRSADERRLLGWDEQRMVTVNPGPNTRVLGWAEQWMVTVNPGPNTRVTLMITTDNDGAVLAWSIARQWTVVRANEQATIDERFAPFAGKRFDQALRDAMFTVACFVVDELEWRSSGPSWAARKV